MEQLSRQEINAIVDAKIRAHELRIGLISGIAGLVFLAGISYCFLLLFFTK
jgi:hypothetical protein